jgi:hypothetical protein
MPNSWPPKAAALAMKIMAAVEISHPDATHGSRGVGGGR